MLAARVVGGRHDCLARRVEAKVCLIHQLVIERGIDGCVVVLDGLVAVMGPTSLDLGTVLEEFVEDALLLVVMNVHFVALDGAAMRSKRPKALSYE